MPQGEMLAEWMRAPMKAWCQVSRTTPERADAPPHPHSQVHPPTGARRTCGWWWARSVRPRRACVGVVVVVIGVPLCGEFVTGTSPDPFSLDDPRWALAGLCPWRHTGSARDFHCSLVVTG